MRDCTSLKTITMHAKENWKYMETKTLSPLELALWSYLGNYKWMPKMRQLSNSSMAEEGKDSGHGDTKSPIIDINKNHPFNFMLVLYWIFDFIKKKHISWMGSEYIQNL